MMTISIRTLGEADLEIADNLLRSAFGGAASRRFDLGLNLQLQPDGWFLAQQGGSPVGMVGATIYGSYAYVGMMAVHENAQRRGVGLALMEHLLEWLAQQEIPLVVLDASPAGQPLYEKLGFVPYEDTLVYQKQAGPIRARLTAPLSPVAPGDLRELAEFDRPIFGADRRKLLHLFYDSFPGRWFLLRDRKRSITGYLCAQRGRIGPWISRSAATAELLLQAALALPFEEPVSVVVPSTNPEALDLLERHGFTRVRTNRHMGRGQDAAPSQRQIIFGQASLSLG